MSTLDEFVREKFQPYRQDGPKLPRNMVLNLQFSPTPVLKVPCKRSRLALHQAHSMAVVRLSYKDNVDDINRKLQELPTPYSSPLSFGTALTGSISLGGTVLSTLIPESVAGFAYAELIRNYRGMYYVWPKNVDAD